MFVRSQMSELEDNILKGEYAVRAIVTYMKGFACSCGAGLIHLFEKTNEEDCYRKLREVEVSSQVVLAGNLFKRDDDLQTGQTMFV